jgi:uncharacterized protein YxeA
MKKARLLLSAIAVFAVAGGAFAFKVVKFGAGNVWYTTTNSSGTKICTLNATLKTTNVGTVSVAVYTAAGCAATVSRFTTTTISGF